MCCRQSLDSFKNLIDKHWIALAYDAPAWNIQLQDQKTENLMQIRIITEWGKYHVNPAAAGPPRHPPAAGGGIKLPPFTSVMILSQREEIEKRNFAHIFLNT